MTRPSALQIGTSLVAAPLAWMVAVQLSQILPYIDCHNGIYTTAICAAVATAVALSAAGLSMRWGLGDEGHPRRFVVSVAGLTALAIGFALMLQLLASLVLNPCER